MLEVVGVFIHVPDVGDILLLEVGMDALADTHQPVLVAAGKVKQLQSPGRLLGIGHQFRAGLGVRCGREAADPREGVEVVE
jgi:hypothetical protein